jgi:hypothetical protein
VWRPWIIQESRMERDVLDFRPKWSWKIIPMRTSSHITKKPDLAQLRILDADSMYWGSRWFLYARILGYVLSGICVYPNNPPRNCWSFLVQLRGSVSKADRAFSHQNKSLEIPIYTEIRRWTDIQEGWKQLPLNLYSSRCSVKPKLIIARYSNAYLDPAERHRFESFFTWNRYQSYCDFSTTYCRCKRTCKWGRHLKTGE